MGDIERIGNSPPARVSSLVPLPKMEKIEVMILRLISSCQAPQAYYTLLSNMKPTLESFELLKNWLYTHQITLGGCGLSEEVTSGM